MFLRVSLLVATIFLLSYVYSQEYRLTGILDGWIARPAQFPFHALIGCIFEDGTIQWMCNGAIINNRFVATSASCVYYCDNLKIRVGSIVHAYMNVNSKTAREYISEPGNKHYAPGYVNGSREHDLALLEVSEQIIYSHSVSAVKLPKFNDSTIAPYVQVVASGFGQPNRLNPWWELQFLTFNVLSASECLEYFPNAVNKTMCAAGTDYNRTVRGSLCEEDGAPVVLKRDNRTLVGLYQYSRPRCDEGGPELILKIRSYIRWIRKTARFGQLDSDIYYILPS